MIHHRVWRTSLLIALLVGFAFSTSEPIDQSINEPINESINESSVESTSVRYHAVKSNYDTSSSSSSSAASSQLSSVSSVSSLSSSAPSATSSQLSLSSSSSSFIPYWDYIESSRVTVPPSNVYFTDIVASSDPSEPDRLFFFSQQWPVIASVDMKTGEALPSLYLSSSECGYNTTRINWVFPISNSLMVYTLTNESNAVIVQLNHTTGDCIRTWPVDVKNFQLYDQHFAVDENSQQFALFTSFGPGSAPSVLSLYSMKTGQVIATTTDYNFMRVSFDPYSGTYLIGANVWLSSSYGQYTQLNGTDLSFIRSVLPTPMGSAAASNMFFDQVGSMIELSYSFGYVNPNGVFNPFVSNVSGQWTQMALALNHDVIGISNGIENNYTAVRFKQCHDCYPTPVSSSSSSSSTASLSTASLLSSISLSSSTSLSSSSSSFESTESSSGMSGSTGSAEIDSSVFTVGVIAGIVIGAIALICFLVVVCVAYRPSKNRSQRNQHLDDVLMTSNV